MPKRPQVKKPTRVVAYVRVSTDKQERDGLSLDAQRAKLEAYATLFDLKLVTTIVDTVSAKDLRRRGLQRALDLLKLGEAGGLLVAKLDRLTRSVRDLGSLVETYFCEDGAALLSVGEQIDTRTAAGRLVLNVLTSVAQWEREAIGERTKAVMRHKQDLGEYIGGRAPYGFKVQAGELVKVEDEQRLIEAAVRARGEGLSLRAVATRLAAEGFTTRGGGHFQPAQVQCVLRAAENADAVANRALVV